VNVTLELDVEPAWLEMVELLTRAADLGIGRPEADLHTHSLALGAQLVATCALTALGGPEPAARAALGLNAEGSPADLIRAAAVAAQRCSVNQLPPGARQVIDALEALVGECGS
jgi:hypothetical protein